MSRLIVIDDDRACCRTLELHFGAIGFDVATASNVDQGFGLIDASPADIVISDIRMPGRDGLSLLEEMGERFPEIPVVMITAYQDLESTVAALKRGAADYVGKPIDLNELETAVERALARRAGRQEDGLVIDSASADGTIIGRSRVMQDVFKSIGMVSQSRVTVLITGESGTGKELIAHAIHKVSDAADKPFVAVNCAALVETLLESEIFGHERGAFTGAVASRRGKAEIAGDGVLFLDEVSELSPRMQGKLLRLLEEREFTAVGGSKPKICRARFVAATNADLARVVAEGDFREDLFYRLNVVNIHAPALRDRSGDIPLLVEHLLARINSEIGTAVRRVTSEALDALVASEWPGNVRQLNNVLTQAVVMAQGDVLTFADFPGNMAAPGDPLADARTSGGLHDEADGPMSLKELEQRHILEVLEQTGWHKGRACEILGISRPRLDRRLKEYGQDHETDDASV